MLRQPKRKEITECDKREMVDAWQSDYDYEKVEVIWKNGKRKYRIDGGYKFILNGEYVGEFLYCDGCGSIFEWIAGNVYDDLERCPECGLPWDEKAPNI